ncbi:MAG: hypothetical protein KDK91_15510 [Gammaproteobacteria bacterium]|nr:hypothetical protein [Gammaproteobacteria bacterium]
MATIPKNLRSKSTRLGLYSKDLTRRIGD